MYRKIIIIILGLGMFQNVNPSSINDLRKSFHQSVLQSDKLPLFLTEIESIKYPSALEKAYIGASEALRVRDAIQSDSKNIEIRFLRFSIEYNIPSIMRSHKSVAEDKSVIFGVYFPIKHI